MKEKIILNSLSKLEGGRQKNPKSPSIVGIALLFIVPIVNQKLKKWIKSKVILTSIDLMY